MAAPNSHDPYILVYGHARKSSRHSHYRRFSMLLDEGLTSALMEGFERAPPRPPRPSLLGENPQGRRDAIRAPRHPRHPVFVCGRRGGPRRPRSVRADRRAAPGTTRRLPRRDRMILCMLWRTAKALALHIGISSSATLLLVTLFEARISNSRARINTLSSLCPYTRT